MKKKSNRRTLQDSEENKFWCVQNLKKRPMMPEYSDWRERSVYSKVKERGNCYMAEGL